MAGNKYLERNATTGRTTEKVSADVSAGAADAGRIAALNASGQIDNTMLPAGIGQNSIAVLANVNLAANDLVEIFDNAGSTEARLASASSATPRPAMGFVTVSVIAGAMANVIFEGRVGGFVGLTPGQRLYLDNVLAGNAISTPVTGAGNLHQFLGKAVSTTEFNFEPDDPIVLA